MQAPKLVISHHEDGRIAAPNDVVEHDERPAESHVRLSSVGKQSRPAGPPRVGSQTLQRPPGAGNALPERNPLRRRFARSSSGGLSRSKLKIVHHIPYDHATIGTGPTKLDLVLVYMFRGESGKKTHETFFESRKPATDGSREGPSTVGATFPFELDYLGQKSGKLDPRKTAQPLLSESSSDQSKTINWLRDMLPTVIPPSRIICVGFDLDIEAKENRIDFDDASQKLLRFLDANRQEAKCRPILFLGHDFGCRVIQRAIGSIARLSNSISTKLLVGVISQNAPPDEEDPVVSGVGLRMDNHAMVATNAPSNKNFLRAFAPELSGTMQEHLVLHHFLDYGSSGKEDFHSLSFASSNDWLFQLICAKIIEWVETHDLLSAVERGDVDAVKRLINIGIDVNRRRNANKMTALHVACQYICWDSADIQTLIEEGNANVALTDALGRTPLHYAVTRETPNVEVVRVLLEAGAETHAPDHEGKTPQRLAELNVNGQRLLDLFQSRPLVKGPSAARTNAKSDQKPSLSETAREVCKAYRMVATTVFLNKTSSSEEYLPPLHLPIDQAIYGNKHLDTMLKDVPVPRGGDKSPICNWYHLPANNMTWAEDLLWHQFQTHLNGWPEQFRDSKWPHGRCINPHTAQFLTESERPVLAMCMPYVSYEDSQHHALVSDAIREVIPSDAPNRPEPWIGYKEMNIHRRSRPSSRRRHRSNSLHVSRHSQGRSRSNSGSDRSKHDDQDDSFSPLEPSSPIDAGSGSDADGPSVDLKLHDKSTLSNREKLLVREYLPKSPPLHIRRTLDQYYYYMLSDTGQRDADQVVTRWARDYLKIRDHNILMVDQLWLWVIAGDQDKNILPSVVTCFPERHGVESGPLDDLRRNIMGSNMGNRQSILPIQTTADLVSRIVSTCSDVFSWSQKEELVRFLHFFEATVGKVGDDETRLLEEFTVQSRQLHMLSEKYRHYALEKDLLLDKLLDIRRQTNLLREVKDIEDEIKIILHVLNEQQRVLEMDHVASYFKQTGPPSSCKDGGQLCKEPLKIIGRAIDNFERLDKQIKEVHNGLNHLMDLQQKQASVWEARSTREGARATSKQGNVMVIFTMVTIIFLPLSFMASFFALDIAEFPADDAGQTNWPLHRVCALLFGISFAVIIPFITLAFVSDWVHGRLLWIKFRCLVPILIFLLECLSFLLMGEKCQRAADSLEDCRDEYYGRSNYTEDHIAVTTDICTADDPTAYKLDCSNADHNDNMTTGSVDGHRDDGVLSRWTTRRRKREPQDQV
ncbi:hypothetical protein MBLNU13_g04281t1 [Cladosporium sp. NU13]